MKIPESKVRKGFLLSIEAIVGKEGYSFSARERLTYSRDSNFRSAIEAHYSHFEKFPSVVVWPQTTVQLSQLIKLAAKYNISVSPYGGGSGVCGGAVPNQDGMVIDLKRMQRVLRVDTDRLIVEVECGIMGLELEKQLDRRGFTLGHFPSSILVATLGGYLAARSAGQCSSKYGKIEDMIIDLEFVDGRGDVHRTSNVSLKHGLDFTQALVGSEGTLGFITKARLKIFPKPQERLFRAIRFQNMEYGVEALRRIMQSGIQPDVLRLYDELDSLLMLSKGSKKINPTELFSNAIPESFKDVLQGFKSRAMSLAFHSHRLINTASRLSFSGCLLIIVLEGQPRIIERQMEIISVICKAMSGVDAGDDLAQNWYEHRYHVAYKASKLFAEGAFTDTMEVATTWDNLLKLYSGVYEALKSQALVLAHISHVYPDGAAIYFTFVAPLSGLSRSLKAYDKLWHAALSATQKAGGVLSHHHGIGRLKAPFIRKEWGEAIQIYDKLKDFFDPHGILNAGVLLPKETETRKFLENIG